jgi:hypothetical protein
MKIERKDVAKVATIVSSAMYLCLLVTDFGWYHAKLPMWPYIVLFAANVGGNIFSRLR